MVVATTSAGDALLNPSSQFPSTFFIIGAHAGSLWASAIDLLATVLKQVAIKPGSMMTTLIPNW
jgi:hypothetical protein